jgi:ABC-type transport system substrate-binding protein
MQDNWISPPASQRGRATPRLTRREVLGGATALGALTLSGFQILDGAFSPAFAEPKRGGVLKAAFSADPAGFDPVRGPSGMSHVVIEQAYSTLMALDPDAKPYPELAESYEVSDDGLQYTFKLRPDVTFHNGDELTAEDVKFSFDRLRAKDSGYSYGSQVERSNLSTLSTSTPSTSSYHVGQDPSSSTWLSRVVQSCPRSSSSLAMT